ELESAILRSIYWFAEAYRDRNHATQFMKLWTCVECFFTIEKEGVIEQVASGITAILTFGGYGIVDHKDYIPFKKRVKQLYDLRSQTVHRARFDHIGTNELDDLSLWVAWVIISMAALANNGNTCLSEVRKETLRLDRLSTAPRK
ncbi:hypothetical protein ACFLZU_03810, partial [Thermodesulfobacteriota bacterium]